MTDPATFTDKEDGRPLPRWRRAYRALPTEARMVASWLWAPVAMGLESMLRFVLRPDDTAMISRPEQLPGLAPRQGKSGTIPHRRTGATASPAPSSIRAVRPSASAEGLDQPPSERRLKIFHAARHSEE